jgi:predicted transcriptional regulator
MLTLQTSEENMATVTARVDEDTCGKLDKLAKATDRSRSWLIADALHRYIEEESWQIAAIEEGVRRADAGDFASEYETKASFARWGTVAE